MKKLISLIFFFFVFFNLFCESFQIQNIEYNFQGRTKEKNLIRKFPIDKLKVFDNQNDLSTYINSIKIDLLNTRIFENIEIEPLLIKDDTEIIKVTLQINLKESFSFLALPYFKIDSNSGATFKIKAKDYNFLGSLNEMNVDANFQIINNDETQEKGYQFGVNFDYDHPFSIGNLPITWNNDYSFYYFIGNNQPEWEAKTGFLLEIPIQSLTLNININQGFYNNFDYLLYDDSMYFLEEIEFSLPICINKSSKYGKTTYQPYLIFKYNWDKNSIDIENSDLIGPLIKIGHNYTFGKINWIKNFRKGLKLTVDNNICYNFKRNEFIPYINFDLYFHHCFENTDNWFLSRLGINANLYGFLYIPIKKNKFYYGEQYGDNLRGIRDEQYFSSDIPEFSSEKALSSFTAITLCLDFPFKLFETNFTKKFIKYFNFELQVAPFIDISLGYNRYTKRYFHPKDGFYTAGMELLVYPLKWSSFTVRGSFGIDMGRLLNIVDTSWRKQVSLYEFSFGLGLHY